MFSSASVLDVQSLFIFAWSWPLKKKRLMSRTLGNPHPFTPDNMLFLPYALPQRGRHKCITPNGSGIIVHVMKCES